MASLASPQTAAVGRFDVCLTADMAYAAPTAVTARAFAKRSDEGVNRVFFVWCDAAEAPASLRQYLDRHGIVFAAMPHTLVERLGAQKLYHIPSTTLARLFLADILQQHGIGKFLYCDGDVGLSASLEPLRSSDVPEDKFAAVGIREEFLPLSPGATREKWQAHLRGLGLPDDSPYFNAGVLLGHMPSYGRIAADAFTFYAANRGACTYLDQDALNVAGGQHRLRLSPRFNFQKSYFNFDVDDVVKPAIYHFNGFWKPWLPTPLTRTWQFRTPFAESKTELAALWPLTWPVSKPLSSRPAYHASALRSGLRGRSKNRKRQDALLRAFRATSFVDGPMQIQEV